MTSGTWCSRRVSGLRAHDIATVTGAHLEMSDEPVQGLLDALSPNAEARRGMGVFPAEVKVADDAPPLDRLLGTAPQDIEPQVVSRERLIASWRAFLLSRRMRASRWRRSSFSPSHASGGTDIGLPSSLSATKTR